VGLLWWAKSLRPKEGKKVRLERVFLKKEVFIGKTPVGLGNKKEFGWIGGVQPREGGEGGQPPNPAGARPIWGRW